jgi:hypothetical protein
MSKSISEDRDEDFARRLFNGITARLPMLLERVLVFPVPSEALMAQQRSRSTSPSFRRLLAAVTMALACVTLQSSTATAASSSPVRIDLQIYGHPTGWGRGFHNQVSWSVRAVYHQLLEVEGVLAGPHTFSDNTHEFKGLHDQNQNTYRPYPHHCASNCLARMSAWLGRVDDRRRDRIVEPSREELMSKTLAIRAEED